MRCLYSFGKGMFPAVYRRRHWKCSIVSGYQKTVPHCMEYGNKEPVRCEWDDPDFAPEKNATLDPDSITLPTFRGCPHVKRIERWKIIRFEVWSPMSVQLRLTHGIFSYSPPILLSLSLLSYSSFGAKENLHENSINVWHNALVSPQYNNLALLPCIYIYHYTFCYSLYPYCFHNEPPQLFWFS